MSYPQIIITGASISQQSFKAGGYGAALVDDYNGRIDVLNRGMSGWNSRQLRKYLETDIDISRRADIKLFVIDVGANDSGLNSFQAIPLPDYEDNLRSIITFIRSTWNAATVILLTPSTCDLAKWAAFEEARSMPEALRVGRSDENMRRYAETCVSIGEELTLPVINVNALHRRAIDESVALGDLYTDGLHYTPLAYSYITQELRKVIAAFRPDLLPQKVPEAFPFFAAYAHEGNAQAAMVAKIIGQKIAADAVKAD